MKKLFVLVFMVMGCMPLPFRGISNTYHAREARYEYDNIQTNTTATCAFPAVINCYQYRVDFVRSREAHQRMNLLGQNGWEIFRVERATDDGCTESGNCWYYVGYELFSRRRYQ